VDRKFSQTLILVAIIPAAILIPLFVIGGLIFLPVVRRRTHMAKS